MISFLAQAYIYGLKQCINPCSLAIILFFVFHVSLIGTSYKRIIYQGIGFLLVIGVMSTYIAAGAFDFIILRKSLQIYFQYSYFIVGILFVLYSLLNFADWFQIRVKKKTSDGLLIKLPDYFTSFANAERIHTSFFLRMREASVIVLGHLIAFGLIICQVIWPADVDLYRIYISLLSGGYQQHIFLFFGFYSFGYLFLFIIVWLTILLIANKNKGKSLSLKMIAFYKILISSLYLSVGIGLIYHFFYR